MLGNNILHLRRDILKISRVKFSLKTGISEHTLRRIEKEEILLSDKIKNKIFKAFITLGIEISNEFIIVKDNNKSKIDEERDSDKRIEYFVRLMKKIHKNIFYIKLQDDKLGGVFKEYSTVFGNKKFSNFDNYVGEHCIISFKKTRKIRQKKAMIRKIKAIDKRYQKLILEKIKGETSDIRIEISLINFVCPIFCIRSYNDYES